MLRVTSTEGFRVRKGMVVVGTGIPGRAVVSKVASHTSIDVGLPPWWKVGAIIAIGLLLLFAVPEALRWFLAWVVEWCLRLSS
jgi:hypothetical protein